MRNRQTACLLHSNVGHGGVLYICRVETMEYGPGVLILRPQTYEVPIFWEDMMDPQEWG